MHTSDDYPIPAPSTTPVVTATTSTTPAALPDTGGTMGAEGWWLGAVLVFVGIIAVISTRSRQH